MCIWTNVRLHKTHAFDIKNFYHKVNNFCKYLTKLFIRGGCGGGGRMDENNIVTRQLQ